MSSSRFSPTSERQWTSPPLARLSDQLVAFAWDEWAQIGVLATPHRRSPWAQDPEALIVFTLEVARADARLFDELMDWLLVNESLLSVRRLRAMCIDETDRALVAAALGWLARQRPRARLVNREPTVAATTLQPLFRSEGPVSKADEDFAAAGWRARPLIPSHKSSPPDPMTPINLAFRLRQILGVGVRSEAIRVLLTTNAPRVNAQTLAHSTGYAKRNVHEALAGLSKADVVSAFTVNGEQRYKAGRPAWAALLGCPPDELPSTAHGPSCSAPSDVFSAGPLSPGSQPCPITCSPATLVTCSKRFAPTWPSPASPSISVPHPRTHCASSKKSSSVCSRRSALAPPLLNGPTQPPDVVEPQPGPSASPSQVSVASRAR